MARYQSSQIKCEGLFQEEEDDVNVANDEIDSSVLLSATKLLESKASMYNVQLTWQTKQMDTGTLGHSTYFDCNVTAGNFTGYGKSHCKKTAKNYAAHELLTKLKSYDANMEDWKQPVFISEMNDPVFLLDQYTKGLKSSLPVYNYVCQKFETGETEHVYQCIFESKVKKGAAPTKELAKRLAAFEMLNDVVRERKKKNKGVNTGDEHSTMHYASLDEVTVNAIRNDSSYVEKFAPKRNPFEVFVRKSLEPGDPSELTTRHFYNVRNPNVQDFTRYMVELQVTFDAVSDNEYDEGMCCANAMNFKNIIEKYLARS